MNLQCIQWLFVKHTYPEQLSFTRQSIFYTIIANIFSVAETFQQDALTKHNEYRKLHNAPELTLNKEMSESAASYAKTLVLLGSMDHSRQTERPHQGENLFMECSKADVPSPNDASKKW